MKLYLIRHAQPEYPSGERMCLGCKIDPALSAAGRGQALALGRAFANVELAAVYHSPLQRAVQTAQALYKPGRAFVALDDLKELDGGEWDGLTFREIMKRYPNASVPPPGGESDESGIERAKNALRRIARETRGDAAAVAHSAFNRTLLCKALGMDLSEKRSIAQSYACINILRYESGQWLVSEVGITVEDWTKRMMSDTNTSALSGGRLPSQGRLNE